MVIQKIEFERCFHMNGKITIYVLKGLVFCPCKYSILVFTDSVSILFDETSYYSLAATYFCQHFWKPSHVISSNTIFKAV